MIENLIIPFPFDPQLSCIENLVLQYIRQNVDESGNCLANNNQIAKDLLLNSISIPTIINKLVKIVYVEQVYSEKERILKWIPVPKDFVSKEKKGFIYIAKDTALENYFKIGYSSSPKVREDTLQAQKPTIVFIHKFVGTMEQEKTIHRYLSKFRVRGEWFKLENEEIAVKAVKKILGI